MVKTELSLEVSNSPNLKVMRLFDTSHYCPDEIIENYLVEVLPVNKTVWVTFNVAKRFSLALNSSNLRYKKASDEEHLIELQDGIYEIKQSFKPNLFTFSHYYHMRTTELSNKLQIQRTKLLSTQCSISRDEYFKERDKLRDIEEFITAAKWMVEECNDKEKGKELYEFSRKLLEKYTNDCKC